jgi:Holliday junction resolvase RusA-like endonuclease
VNNNKLKEKVSNINPLSGNEVVEIPGTKTLWLILFSYLNVLFNSAPDQMNIDELGIEINSQHEQCQKYPGMGLLYARNAGEWLLEAKTKLQPDEWQRWLKTNCKFSEKTAETYMQMAKGWPGFRVTGKKDVKTENTISYSPEVAAILESLSPFSNSEDTPVSVEIIEDIEDLEVIESAQLSTDELSNDREEEDHKKVDDREFEHITEDLDAVESSNLSANIESISAVAVEILEVIEPAKISANIKAEPPIVVEALEVIDIDDYDVNIESKSANLPLSKGENENRKSLDPIDVTIATYSQVEKRDQEVMIFFIPGNVVPKARPRVTGNGTYMPQRYKAWRNMAEVEIYTQLSGRDLTTLPIKKASILMRFVGKHRTNSDLDNLAGACLDALTMNGAGVLVDDRISCVSKLSVEYLPDAKNTGVWIEITPVD